MEYQGDNKLKNAWLNVNPQFLSNFLHNVAHLVAKTYPFRNFNGICLLFKFTKLWAIAFK